MGGGRASSGRGTRHPHRSRRRAPAQPPNMPRMRSQNDWHPADALPEGARRGDLGEVEHVGHVALGSHRRAVGQCVRCAGGGRLEPRLGQGGIGGGVEDSLGRRCGALLLQRSGPLGEVLARRGGGVRAVSQPGQPGGQLVGAGGCVLRRRRRAAAAPQPACPRLWPHPGRRRRADPNPSARASAPVAALSMPVASCSDPAATDVRALLSSAWLVVSWADSWRNPALRAAIAVANPGWVGVPVPTASPTASTPNSSRSVEASA